ncbi:MAG: hypothetical protein JW802_07010 [Campylobacterales bacterium]|nr:hypothetical protein [Campylobacterales bacterium]
MNITESTTYTEGIYQIELTDPVIGGADGISNLQAKQLANRTNWLKAAVDGIKSSLFEAAKALKLSTARKISLGGALSGSANFDGSADITINASFADGTLTINSIQGLATALNGKQASDATLTALANVTTSANKLIYATGSDAFALCTLTPYARTLLATLNAKEIKEALEVRTLFDSVEASGTYFDFDNIPSWANKITIILNAVSTNGSNGVLIQFKTAQGIEVTGYFGSTVSIDSNLNTHAYSTGFLNITSNSTMVKRSVMEFFRFGENFWIETHTGSNADSSAAISVVGNGSKNLATRLTGIRITTQNATDTFDFGTVSINVEG